MERIETLDVIVVSLQATKESNEGMARTMHALLYTRELKEHGHAAALLFDGAGTEWAEEFTKPDSTNRLPPMCRELSKPGVTDALNRPLVGQET